MYRIIDGRGTGKTNRLLLLAKENNGVVVCSNPDKMREKAYAYGLTGIDFVSYKEFDRDVSEGYEAGTSYNKPVFIDELDNCLKHLQFNIKGYTISNED